jgi:integrase
VSVCAAGAKRKRRQRTVDVADDGEWALKKLYERALKLGCEEGSEHYLVPGIRSRYDKHYDPHKMCNNWRMGMKGLLGIIQTHFRDYDLRHHAISEALGDSRISLTEASEHFGHISDVMRKRYYHGSRESSRKVAEIISGKRTVKKQREAKKPVGRVDNAQIVQGSFTYSAWSPRPQK